jgi:pimeloyl-ACP methyl ester carboxylesterase
MSIWSHEVGPDGAPLIVLIHGAMDRSAGMLKLSRQLDVEYRVLRYDRRGYGRSKPHPGPFTVEAHVDDLVTLLAGRRALLVGHSFGGNVALATAERHPALVRAVAVYETPLSWLEWWPGSTAGGRGMDAVQGTPEDAAERFMRRMIGNRRWEALPERTREERRAEGPTFVEELVDLGSNEPWRAYCIGAPVIAMYGELGREHHRDGADYIADLLSDRDPIVIADAGHNGPFTHPEPVAAVVRALDARAPA